MVETTVSTSKERSLRDLLKARVAQLGISQAELARRAAVNSQFISDISTGKKVSIRRDAVFKLALAMQISPLVLLRILDPSFGEHVGNLYTDVRQITRPITDRLFSDEALAKILPAQCDTNEVFPVLQHPLSFDETKLLSNRRIRLYRWPAMLGPANGSYGIAHPENPLSIYPGLLIASPERSIKLGDLFVGFVCFEQSRPVAWIFHYQDSDRDSFRFGVDGSEDSVELPRAALVRAHRIVALVGKELIPIQAS
jgi:transcriptional regulator with XRE-family HTH domain